jgi:hypothetical protein
MSLDTCIMIWQGGTIKLPRQMDPREDVMERQSADRTAFEQHGLISSGWNHHVPTALATVARTIF